MEGVVALAQTAAHGSLDDGLCRSRSFREQRHAVPMELGPESSALPVPDLATRRKSSSAIAVQQNQFIP